MEIQVEIPGVTTKKASNVSVTYVAAADIASTFGANSIDLISKPLGSRILATSDEWFADASNLTTPGPPVHRPGVFTHAGAWYDGWETRRHNTQPFDWVVFRLGVSSGRVKGVEIDTGFFNGNHAPEVGVQGCYIAPEDEKAEEEKVSSPDFKGWKTILDRQECEGARRQAWLLKTSTEEAYTHVRLQMFPDGGIGRFRLYGDAVPIFPSDPKEVFELSATVNGGVATRCSDQHFGVKDNLILPGRGVDMGDGWETKRSRGVHIDWVIIRLGTPGEIQKIVVDTAHFRGNFPQKVQVYAAEGPEEPEAGEHEKWTQVLAPTKTGPDVEHFYEGEQLESVQGKGYAFAKLVIIPDGGVKRFRVFGRRWVE